MSKSFFKYLFKQLDIYGSPIIIKIRGKLKYTTAVGGVFSILTFIMVVIFSFIFATDMILHENPTLINYVTTSDEQKPLVNNKNLLIGFQVWYPNRTVVDLMNNPYWGVELHTEDRERIYPDYKLHKENVEIDNCSDENFYQFSGVNKTMQKYIVDNFYCPKFNNLSIVGNPYQSLKVNFLRLKIKYNWKKLMEDYHSNELALYKLGVFPFRISYDVPEL